MKKKTIHKRSKMMIFRVSPLEFDHFAKQAKKRHMAKAELFRYLLARYFVDK